MIDLEAKITGRNRLIRRLRKEAEANRKDLALALRVEAFGQMKKLKREIRSGAPGGRRFHPLSTIARRLGRTRRPLRKLAAPVRYYIPKGKDMEVHFGWVGPQVSKSWKRIAEFQQKGGTFEISDTRRQSLRRWGAHFKGKRGKAAAGDAKYFFLRKTTTTARVKPRPILDPFWRAHEDEAWKNIRKNFRRKRAGQRI